MEDLLALKDIHIQGDIGWQLAWGWWILILLFIVVLLALIFYLRKIWQRKQIKNSAKQLLKKAFDDENPAIQCLLVLRSYADFIYPDANINTFNEQQWQDFLAKKLPPSEALTALFRAAMYQKSPSFNQQELLNYCQKWVDHV